MYASQSHSPPPLRHPVPTHPAYIPEPPSTPVSPQGYQRFSSSPAPPTQPQQNSPPQAYSTHVPAYTSPFQHSQPHPPPQQPPIPPNFVPPWGLNDTTAQFGLQLGSSAVAAGQEYVQRNFGTFLPTASLKQHFNVSNSYVLQKLKLLVWPWRHKPWNRKTLRIEQGVVEWFPPREDINSPDLYIPAMALVTYVLTCAFHYGLKQRFHPKLLGDSASFALAIVLLDFTILYLGCYFLNVQASGNTAVDLISYTGYKFVGVVIMILFSFLNIGWKLWWLIFLYLYAANVLFLLRSLRSVVLPDPNIAMGAGNTTGAKGTAQRRNRIWFLFVEAIFCQGIFMYVLASV